MANLDQDDLNAIRLLMHEEVRGLEQRIGTLEQKTSLLPSREDFFARMDEILGIIRNMRDELVALTHRVRGHEDIHPGGQHPTS